MVSVRCDGNWSLSVTDDWVRVAPKSGIGNATVSIVADSNVGGELRTARVIFTAGSLEPATVSVSQTGEGSIPEEIVSPDGTPWKNSKKFVKKTTYFGKNPCSQYRHFLILGVE